ncbi:hypothetical protein ES707_11974 [subsurface metagenome]
MSNKNKTEETTPEPTIDELLNELPLKDEHKQLLVKVVSGIAGSLQAINTRLDSVEKQPGAENPDLYAGLSAEQKYQVMMAKASAPAAAAQQELWGTLLSRAGGGSGGGSGGGDLAALAKSAESIQALRNILSPAPSALQIATEKAQVSQILAQTRLMNKVAGKATDEYLEKIAAEVEAAGAGGAEE